MLPEVIREIIFDYKCGLEDVIKRNERRRDLALYFYNVYPMFKYYRKLVDLIGYQWCGDDYRPPDEIPTYNSFREFVFSCKWDYHMWQGQVNRMRAYMKTHPQFYDSEGNFIMQM